MASAHRGERTSTEKPILPLHAPDAQTFYALVDNQLGYHLYFVGPKERLNCVAGSVVVDTGYEEGCSEPKLGPVDPILNGFYLHLQPSQTRPCGGIHP